VDYSQEDHVKNLIRAHQKLLLLASFCNKCMSVANCYLTGGSVYLSVVTGFAMIFDHALMENIMLMGITMTSIMRFGFMSELIKEVRDLLQKSCVVPKP